MYACIYIYMQIFFVFSIEFFLFASEMSLNRMYIYIYAKLSKFSCLLVRCLKIG